MERFLNSFSTKKILKNYSRISQRTETTNLSQNTPPTLKPRWKSRVLASLKSLHVLMWSRSRALFQQCASLRPHWKVKVKTILRAKKSKRSTTLFNSTTHSKTHMMCSIQTKVLRKCRIIRRVRYIVKLCFKICSQTTIIHQLCRREMPLFLSAQTRSLILL